jgi:hypothetical protein
MILEKEINDLLKEVEEEFRIFERPSADNSMKMMKLLQNIVKNNSYKHILSDEVCDKIGYADCKHWQNSKYGCTNCNKKFELNNNELL